VAISQTELRRGVIALAYYTGWSKHEIMNMPISELIWWIEGLPRDG
jgi:hypothetical protein